MLLVPAPRHPVHPRGAVRVEAPERVCQHRHVQMMGERGERHLGVLLCLSSDPFQSQRDGQRARSPLPLSCHGSEMTPGVAFAAPGPMDGGGSLASRSRGFRRTRVFRLAMSGDVFVCGCWGRW